MRIAGGVIALIAGIFGLIAAITTLFFGGVGAAFSADGADTVLRLGWGGIAFSFLVIVYGACTLGSKGRWAGYLTIISAIGGWFLGGLLVGICMVLALIGGMLSLFQARSEEDRARQSKVAVAVAVLPLLIVAALSAESVYEAKHPAGGQESVAKVAASTPNGQSEVNPASTTSVASGDTGQVSCKNIPTELWKSIQGAGATNRGTTDCSDVNLVSRGDIDGDGKADVVAVWSSEGSCIDSPDEPSGSCGNHVVQFVSVELGNGEITQPVRLKEDATGIKVVPKGVDIDVLKYGPDDPHCCPSVKAVEHLVLQSHSLVNAESPSDGDASHVAVRMDVPKNSGANDARANEAAENSGNADDGSANGKKCALAANTTYQAAQLRFDPGASNEEKIMKLMQSGANENLAGALLAFATERPTDSADLLKQVVMDDCTKGNPEAIDSDPRLHPVSR
jgi:hypothetical protein